MAAFFASQAPAAELIFKNGERLRGSIVEIGNDTVRFKSDNLGEITVPLASVEIKRDAVPPAVAKASEAPKKPPAKKPVQVSEDAPEPALMEKDESRRLHDIALERWTSLWEENAFWSFVARYYPLKTWKNRLDFGFFFENSNRKDLRYDFGFSTEKRVKNHETKFSFSYAYREIDEKVNRNWTRGNLLYRYDIAERIFAQSTTRYQRRPEASIFRELSESVGVGYRWLDAESIRGTITPEIGLSYADIGDASGFWVAIGTFVQDFEIDISDTLKVTQDLLLQYSPSDEGDFVSNLQLGLENRITKSLSLRVVYDYTYDERVDEARNSRTKETVRVTFGARF